jgi:hypothetical protein
MKLTKLQRHWTYMFMLAEFDIYQTCLCSVYNTLTGDGSWTYMYDILPELFSKRTKKDRDGFWFNNDNERLEVLNQCINETA